MAKQGEINTKTYTTEVQSNARITTGVGDEINVNTTSDANEQTYTPSADAYQVQIINNTKYDSVALTGEARIALIAAQTADAGNYVFLASGASVTLDVGDGALIYYKRDAAVDVTLTFIERKV